MIAGDVDTGDKFILDTGDQLSAVTTTPAINLSLVTRTRTPWRWGAAKNRQKKPKGLKFIVGVNDTAEKLFTGVNNTADKFFAGVESCQY